MSMPVKPRHKMAACGPTHSFREYSSVLRWSAQLPVLRELAETAYWPEDIERLVRAMRPYMPDGWAPRVETHRGRKSYGYTPTWYGWGNSMLFPDGSPTALSVVAHECAHTITKDTGVGERRKPHGREFTANLDDVAVLIHYLMTPFVKLNRDRFRYATLLRIPD